MFISSGWTCRITRLQDQQSPFADHRPTSKAEGMPRLGLALRPGPLAEHQHQAEAEESPKAWASAASHAGSRGLRAKRMR